MTRGLAWVALMFELWAWHSWLAFTFSFQAARAASVEGTFANPLRILAVWPVLWLAGGFSGVVAIRLGERVGMVGCGLAVALGVAVLANL